PVFTGIQPRINIDLLKEKLDDIYNSNYYIIGTSDFIKTMKTLLEENHIDKKKLFS
ncbi:flavodoxins/hemoprotein, partial [Fusobacterium animalis ATCC 51191]